MGSGACAVNIMPNINGNLSLESECENPLKIHQVHQQAHAVADPILQRLNRLGGSINMDFKGLYEEVLDQLAAMEKRDSDFASEVDRQIAI
ncbi:hypothetical protein SESBI_15091 [Sesbania bispinosa]|nr:hypothetical protein SESBI_15091 [Sesbania bispinosa]